jgi:DNA repair protein RecO (recombination protein O)
VRSSFSGLREGLRKIWCASLIGEFLQKTSGGGGDYPLVLSLALEALTCLEGLPEDRADYPTLLFLWKMLGLLGLMPDPSGCASCGKDLGASDGLHYVPASGGFVCPACARAEEGRPLGWHEHGSIPLSAGAGRWLFRSLEWTFPQAARVGLDGPSLESLRSLIFHLAQKAAEGPLASLQSGLGII